VVLAGVQHRPGVHRGSTALAEALRTHGLGLSETHVIQGRLWLEVDAPIEKRGWGGGTFRLLHARFLEDERRFHEEVAALAP
jgi:hypothetical protein